MIEGTRVIVTFIDLGDIDLEPQDITQTQTEALRNNLVTSEEDWESPEMSVYANYDAAKSSP
jgi:hypothetical protein